MSHASLQQLRDKQRDTWNSASDGWKKWDGFITAWWLPVCDRMLARAMLQPTDRILDVATGTGEPGLTAARHVRRGHVIGVDVSEDMLEVAAEKARAQGAGNYATRHYDGMALPFEENSFDVALCRFGVIFFPDMIAGTRDLLRVIKPGGRVVMSSWLARARNPFISVPGAIVFQTLGLTPPPPEAPGLFRCTEPGALSRVLQDAGCTGVEEEEVSHETDFGTLDDYWDWLMSVPAPITVAIKNASREQMTSIRNQVLDEIGAFVRNGRVLLPWAAWVASGHKPGQPG